MQERQEHRASRYKKPSLIERFKNKIKSAIAGDSEPTQEKKAPADPKPRVRYRPADMNKEIIEFLEFSDRAYSSMKLEVNPNTIHMMIWVARTFVRIKNIRGKQKDQFMLRVRQEMRELKQQALAA